MKKILLSILMSCSLMSARATLFQYSVTFDGPSESPANASPGIGFGTANYDDVAHTLALNVSFSGLLGTTTASHIHAATAVAGTGTAGVATTTPTFAGFPLGVTSGTYANVLDLTLASSYNPSYVTANGGTTATAEVALAAAMAADKAYWNIHTSVFGGGEIRGFLTPVPEPSTYLAGALSALLCGVRGVRSLRHRKQAA
jgi:CHRD domain